MSHAVVRPMMQGPIDIIGDVHGELDALKQLLSHLGYDAQGNHANNRRIIFVGDLCDRGPDSPGVALMVKRMVEAGRAQCVLGNHELNVLRCEQKLGNGWWHVDDHDHAKGKHLDCRRADEGQRQEIYDFFASLPLALERDDLRVIHAAWDDDRLAQVQRELTSGGYAELHRTYAAQIGRDLEASGISAKAREEDARLEELLAADQEPDEIFAALAAEDMQWQMANPISVLTSGVEAVGKTPFHSSGRWRMIDRVRWWNEYNGKVPVVIGHYWRSPGLVDRAGFGKGDPDLFDDVVANHWHGRHRNVFCIDYSVGRRCQERERGLPIGSSSALGALRWPERELFFDDGRKVETV